LLSSPLTHDKLDELASKMAPVQAQLAARKERLEARRQELLCELCEAGQQGQVERAQLLANELQEVDRLVSFVAGAQALLLSLLLRLETFRDLCLLLESLRISLRALTGLPKLIEELLEAQRALREELGEELAELLTTTSGLVHQALANLRGLYGEVTAEAEAFGPNALRELATELQSRIAELKDDEVSLPIATDLELEAA
jgi:division protein CdvB (Snf7/Vps24/ESCRT-III family)